MAYEPTDFSTLLRGTMDAQGFVDIELPIPITTHRKDERLAVALKSAHIPNAMNAGLYDNRPWEQVKEEGQYLDPRHREWARFWLTEVCVVTVDDGNGPQEEERMMNNTNTGLCFTPSSHFENPGEYLRYMISQMKPYVRAMRNMPADLSKQDDPEDQRAALLPGCIVNPHEWLEVVENGKFVSIRQKEGLAEHMYGKEWAHLFRPWVMLNFSKMVNERLGVPEKLYVTKPTSNKNIARGMGDSPIMHLMMEELMDSYVSGGYGPVLHSYIEGDTNLEPQHIHFVTLKDTHNSGDHSVHHSLRFWIEGAGGVKKFLSGLSPPEITLDLQWRSIILTSTAQSEAGVQPEKGMGMKAYY